MIKSFKDILQTMFNAVVGSTLSDFNIGSVTRTVLEAVASAIEEAYMYLYKFVLKFSYLLLKVNGLTEGWKI